MVGFYVHTLRFVQFATLVKWYEVDVGVWDVGTDYRRVYIFLTSHSPKVQGKIFRDLHDIAIRIVVEIPDELSRVCFRDNERVAGHTGVDVEKRQYRFVFVDLVARYFAANYFVINRLFHSFIIHGASVKILPHGELAVKRSEVIGEFTLKMASKRI